MTDDWIEDSALRFEGFTDAQIAEIKTAIPKAQTLVANIRKNLAVLNQLQLELTELLPTADMVLTVMKGRMT